MLYEMPSVCPVCGSGFKVTRLSCDACGSVLEGNFGLDRISLLSKEMRRFTMDFLKCRGNIREMEKLYGISYPTVRARIDDIVTALGEHPSQDEPDAEDGSAEVTKAASGSDNEAAATVSGSGGSCGSGTNDVAAAHGSDDMMTVGDDDDDGDTDEAAAGDDSAEEAAVAGGDDEAAAAGGGDEEGAAVAGGGDEAAAAVGGGSSESKSSNDVVPPCLDILKMLAAGKIDTEKAKQMLEN